LNTADRRDLLRVPGIGPKGAHKLLRERRRGRLCNLSDLRKLGVAARRAAPYILLDGRRPAHQLTFWPT
jgi:predicted DNA-binding helix-hairpin-helix protein